MNAKAYGMGMVFGVWVGLVSSLNAAEEPAVKEPAAADQPALAPEGGALEVTVDGDQVSIHARGVTVEEVVDRLRENYPIKLDVPAEILGQRVSLDLKKVPFEKVIETLAGSNALIYERDGEGYKLVSARLTTQQEYVPLALPEPSRKEKRDVEAKHKQAKAILSNFSAIFGYAGELDYDVAKALIQDRQAKVQAIVDQLAALGPGGARAMQEIYSDTGRETREQQSLIQALGKIDDEESSRVLGSLYGDENRYSLLREIVGALGGRTDADAEAVLSAILAGTSDMRLRGGAVQALGGRPDALSELTGIVNTETESMDVRQETVRSIGRIGTDEARGVLTSIASATGNLTMRKTAIQELGRSFGEAAVPDLNALLKDPDDGVRQSSIHALGRVGSSAAMDSVRVASTSDVSPLVRAHAESVLAGKNAESGTTPSPN